jgi:hypothetical protein
MNLRCASPVLAGLILCVSVLTAGERPSRTKPNYYPIEAGNQWTYRLEANGK